MPAARDHVLKASLRELAERLAQLNAERALVVLVSEGLAASLIGAASNSEDGDAG